MIQQAIQMMRNPQVGAVKSSLHYISLYYIDDELLQWLMSVLLKWIIVLYEFLLLASIAGVYLVGATPISNKSSITEFFQ
jgi:hypothetical protein